MLIERLIALFMLLVASCRAATQPLGGRDGGDPPGTFHGRHIATPMSAGGAAWLDRPERERREQPDAVVDALALAPGMTVADIGAGSGYMTVRLARKVGPTGKVYATDIQAEMLRLLRARVAAEDLHNVEPVLVTGADAGLPAGSLDLALLVDVYHELADPAAVMAGVRRALRADGRLVLVEYRGEDPDVPIRPEHKMTLAQIQDELESLGFVLREHLEFLPDQRIVIFAKRP